MKKIIAALLSSLFLFSSQIPANAANQTLKAGKAITMTFPKTVVLKKSGCQNIPVTYKVGNMPTISFASFAILDDSDALIGGGDTIYKTPAFSDGKIYKKIGKFDVKICRKAWQEDIGDGEYQDFVGASKGEFQVYVVVYPSTEEYSTIQFR